MITFEFFKTPHGSLDAEKIRRIKDMVGATCFIETGTYLGDTTEAMRGIFDRVVTIELSKELFARACQRFAEADNVVLLQGDSAERIGDALHAAEGRRSMIWLDAHFSGGVTAKASENTPILSEIRRLRQQKARDITVLVDDISYFWAARVGFSRHESAEGYPEIGLLIKELMELNPRYRIFINGDVLFAIPGEVVPSLDISPLLSAMTRLRVGRLTDGEVRELEARIADADGTERQALLEMPEHLARALEYGNGGHFCYWRGLVLERSGSLVAAKADFSLARRCGIDIPVRRWESSPRLALAEARQRTYGWLSALRGKLARTGRRWGGRFRESVDVARGRCGRLFLLLRVVLRRPSLATAFAVEANLAEAEMCVALAGLEARRTAMEAFQRERERFDQLLLGAGRAPLHEADLYPCLSDRTPSTEFDRHYIYHPAWAARVLARTRPKKHVDISSTLHFCTVLSAFVPVEFYDYRPAKIALSGLRCDSADLKGLPFGDGSVESISCMHVLEHIGLGRYGDELDVDGDVRAASELTRVVAKGGRLLVVVPVGQPRIQFNAHRIYLHERVLEMFRGLSLEEHALIPDGAAEGGLIVNPDAALVDAQIYGCGCYLFRKVD